MYEAFAHTADLGLRITAGDLNELFAEAGRAFFSVIVTNLDDVQPTTRVEFAINRTDLSYLLADWLNELLFSFESKRLLLCEFEVSIDDHRLKAAAKGEVVDEARHHLDHEIKAVTYHGLSLRKVNDKWLAEVILDI